MTLRAELLILSKPQFSPHEQEQLLPHAQEWVCGPDKQSRRQNGRQRLKERVHWVVHHRVYSPREKGSMQLQ